MTQIGNNIVNIYTEATPNPETMKFVANKLILQNNSIDFATQEDAQISPLAAELFLYPFVKGVFFASNFVTVTKTQETDWLDVIPTIKEFLKTFLEMNKEVVSKDYFDKINNAELSTDGDDNEIVARIKDLLDTYVKPAVEMDGGAIQFKSYNKGVVTVSLQGACSGCPSSMITLKNGIEGMMKKMIPEVQEVATDSE